MTKMSRDARLLFEPTTKVHGNDSYCKRVQVESEIVRVVSLSKTELSEITCLKIRSSWSDYLKGNSSS